MEYGLPKLNKYPVDTVENIQKCVKFFVHCPEEHKEELANNIYKASLKEGYEIDGNEDLFRYVDFSEELKNESLYDSNFMTKIIPRTIEESKLTKEVYILLTNTKTTIGKVIKTFMGSDYNHVSISLDKSFNKVYGMGRNIDENEQGFIAEKLDSGFYKRNDAEFLQLELKVTEYEYLNIVKNLEFFKRNKKKFNFYNLGLVISALNIPVHKEYEYVCSTFIGYIFFKSGIKLFNKDYSLVRPVDFYKHPAFIEIDRGRVVDKLARDRKMFKEDIEDLDENCVGGLATSPMSNNTNFKNKYIDKTEIEDVESLNETVTKKLYHLSDVNLDDLILIPRIPNNVMTRYGREENKTPRISFSTSIKGALIGITGDLTGKEFYVYEIDETFSKPIIREITSKEVPDQFISNEIWVLNKVKLKKTLKIKVTRTFSEKIKQGRGSMTYNSYEFKTIKDSLNETEIYQPNVLKLRQGTNYEWDSDTIEDEIKEKLNESYVFSTNDIYQNFDEWKKEKGKNILYVTGLSGSGKTTLGEEFEKKYNAKLFEIDGIEWNYDSTNSGILDKVKSKYPEYKRVVETEVKDLEKIGLTKKQYYHILSNACKMVTDIIGKDYNTLYIIEGIQIFQYWEGALVNTNNPLVIKGSSVVKSIWRRWKRNGNGHVNLIKELKNEFPDLFKWYMDMEKDLTKFKKSTLKEDINYKSKGHMNLSSFNKTKLTRELAKENGIDYGETTFKDFKGYLYTDKKDNSIKVALLAVATYDDKKSWIQPVEVYKKYKGYGLSKQLLDVAVKELGAKYLSVYPDNTLSIDIYKKYGFKIYKKNKWNMYLMTLDPNQKIDKEYINEANHQSETFESNEVLTEAPKTNKRKEMETLIYNFFNIIDKTGKNAEKYKKMFTDLTDEQFDKFMKKFLNDPNQNFYLEVLPNKNEPVLKDIKKCADLLKIPLDEYVYYRHDGDKLKPVRTAYKVPVGYLILKRMQQTLSKKNTYSLSISSRNMKTGQLTSHDKIARISDIESYSLEAIGANYALKELLGPRADNMESKTEMYKQIGMYGYAYQKDLPKNIEKSQAINTVSVYMTGAGLENDLLSTDE